LILVQLNQWVKYITLMSLLLGELIYGLITARAYCF